MRRKVDLVILLAVLVAGVFAIQNAVVIGDWWHAQRYSPPTEISKLAEDAGMSDKGKQLFFRFSPQLLDQKVLDTYCDKEKLGCTEGRSIYILQSINDAEYSRNIVTATHEMLHVAYSRLKTTERANLGALLKAELDKPTAADVVKQLKDYPAEDYYNEAHSYIGSELSNISPELESYYKTYFADRSQSTQAYSYSHP